METITIPFKQFRFNDFMRRMLEFSKEITDIAYAVPWVMDPGDIPEYDEDNIGRNYLTELKEEKKYLYLAFSSTNIGEPIHCADKKEYEIDDNFNFCLGEADTVGYLLKFENGDLIINSAINAAGACTAPPPSIDIEKKCYIFDNPIQKFISEFIIK